jgi:hypothetical protein
LTPRRSAGNLINNIHLHKTVDTPTGSDSRTLE